MVNKDDLFEKVDMIYDLAMGYEVAMIPFFEEDYLEEFLDLYEVKRRNLKLIPVKVGFDEALRDVSGEYRWEAIAEKAKSLFGLPDRITEFEDITELKEELEGPCGLVPFFFFFGLMFCEYEGYTLCFMSGTNN